MNVEDDIRALVTEIEETYGSVDVVVSNAADGALGPLEETTVGAMRAQFETNVFGPTLLTQLVVPAMRAKGSGRIIAVSSMGAEHTTPCSGSYHATKYATNALADSWRFELRPFGITYVIVQPAVVATPMAVSGAQRFKDRSTGLYGPLMLKMGQMAETAIAKRQGVVSADDVADAIVHAATADKPKTRYRVGIAAHILPAMRRYLPDRAYDAVWRRAFGQ